MESVVRCYTELASLGAFAVRGRDLLSISELTPSDLARFLDTAMALKDAGRRPILSGKTLALVFESASWRVACVPC